METILWQGWERIYNHEIKLIYKLIFQPIDNILQYINASSVNNGWHEFLAKYLCAGEQIFPMMLDQGEWGPLIEFYGSQPFSLEIYPKTQFWSCFFLYLASLPPSKTFSFQKSFHAPKSDPYSFYLFTLSVLFTEGGFLGVGGLDHFWETFHPIVSQWWHKYYILIPSKHSVSYQKGEM